MSDDVVMGNGRYPPTSHPWRDSSGGIDDEDDDSDVVITTDEVASGRYECLTCGYRTDIDTPQIRVDHWCRGECNEFTWFKRRDHVEQSSTASPTSQGERGDHVE